MKKSKPSQALPSLVSDVRETSPEELDKQRLYEELLDMVEVERRRERTEQARLDADKRRAEAREKYLKEKANSEQDAEQARASATDDTSSDLPDDGDAYAAHGDLQYFDDASATDDQKEARMDMIKESEARYAPTLSAFASLMRHTLSWSSRSLGFYMTRHRSPEMSTEYDRWRFSFKPDADYTKKQGIFSQRVSRFIRPLCSQLGMTDTSARLAELGMADIVCSLSFREAVPTLKPQSWCMVTLILLKCLEFAQSPFADSPLEVPHSTSATFAKVVGGLKYDVAQYESLIKLFFDEYTEPEAAS